MRTNLVFEKIWFSKRNLVFRKKLVFENCKVFCFCSKPVFESTENYRFFGFLFFCFLDFDSVVFCSCSTKGSLEMFKKLEDFDRPESISAIRTWIFGLLESLTPPNSSPSLWPALATTHGNSQEIRKLTMSRRGLGTTHGDPQHWPALLRAHRGFSSSTGIVSNGYLSR